ncbi:hypothetical protein NXS19_013904 [Fusarium pseudograminearum]|nr:hypothetical protein NXS19_013904 [Fusarium pseudograminearum]
MISRTNTYDSHKPRTQHFAQHVGLCPQQGRRTRHSYRSHYPLRFPLVRTPPAPPWPQSIPPYPRGKSPSDNDLQDIAVILPVVDYQSENFIPTVESILKNFPGQLYVVVVGRGAYDKVEPQMAALRKKYGHSQIHIGAVNKASTHRQIAHALSTINHRDFRLTVITEQGAYWPPRFLPSACYPFDDEYVSAVTVPKKAHIPPQSGIWAHVKAYLFSFHYCVQAEDNCAVNCLDRSALFGGPTTLVRTYLLKENRFKDEFEKEMWFYERFGPLTGGEHFFLNRYLLGGNKKIFFQDSPDATVSVEMNSIREFIAPQCASLYYHHGHVIYPAATRMTWWPTIFSLATQIDLLTIVLVLNDSLLNKAAFCVFIIVAFLMAGYYASCLGPVGEHRGAWGEKSSLELGLQRGRLARGHALWGSWLLFKAKK